MAGNLFTIAGRKRVVILVAGRTHNSSKVHTIFINNQYYFFSKYGALKYESDGVPTGEQKRAFGVGFRKKRSLVVGSKKFHKIGFIQFKLGQI